MVTENPSPKREAFTILLCGGIAGVITWASVFPLDVIKTRLQAQQLPGTRFVHTPSERQTLLGTQHRDQPSSPIRVLSSVEITKHAFRSEGLSVFYRGLGVCSLRAFIVNAVQVCCTHARLNERMKTDNPSGLLMNGS